MFNKAKYELYATADSIEAVRAYLRKHKKISNNIKITESVENPGEFIVWVKA